ncbi:50S ribosomal protein L17 [Candidatus Saccharibacteria bacterium]|jgi:large subunit ribosomal protein L17|nr:50S ribosomal protein L17 [Candidatus Saccharibacteria bacterium]
MHRHGYKGRKFGRERDQRQALMKGLACALIEHQSIKTTLPKAKELRPFAEKLITRAKKGGLFDRRLVIARTGSIELGNLLVDVIVPQIKRESGYLRITKLDARRGDNAPMAQISFVDEIKLDQPKPAEPAKKKPAVSTTPAKKPAAKAKTAPQKKADTAKKGDK